MRRLLPFLALALAACSSSGPGADAASTSADTAAAAPSAAAAPAPAVATAADPWAVRFDGAGPVRVGMTLEEARAALGGDFRPQGEGAAARPDACLTALAGGSPAKLSFMVDGRRVVRVDARDSSTVATMEGVRVGDSEARVQEVYAGRVQVQPHKYDEKGRYLVVRPVSSADTTHLLVFETDGRRVVRYRAGARPQVEWVEGCS